MKQIQTQLETKLKFKRIEKNYVILCEGVDTKNFLLNYLQSQELKSDSRFSNDIQLIDFGGINDLRSYICNLIQLDDFETVRSMLIIRDAETDSFGAVTSIQTALTKNGLPSPQGCNIWVSGGSYNVKIAFSLMPSCSVQPVEGALEDLCWEVLNNDSDKQIRNEVDNFVSRMKDKYHCIVSHKHKSKLHTFFSINEKLISLKIGEASKAGAFDWDSDKLKPLKDVIMEGFVK